MIPLIHPLSTIAFLMVPSAFPRNRTPWGKITAAFPVDSLRSRTFTSQMGGTASSIMDYARFNYVAQPEDGVERITPVIGAYDKYAVSWAYRWLDVEDSHEELPQLNEWDCCSCR